MGKKEMYDYVDEVGSFNRWLDMREGVKEDPPSMSTSSLWSPPSEFDDYRLVRLIGSGGMGQVYLGHDKLLDRPVAIKFISALAPDGETRRQFLIEARAAARLQHPNVVSVYRIAELEGRPYIVSEFVRGTSLAEMDKPLPWQRVLEIALSLARGLAIAHRRGVLHRDIKPANVLVTEEGEAKLLDFGIAELLGTAPHNWSSVRSAVTSVLVDPDTPSETAGDPRPKPATPPTSIPPPPAPGDDALSDPGPLKQRIVGTPDYVPPEIWLGMPGTRRSDIFSLGALLYELCAGRPPNADVPTKELRHVLPERPLLSLSSVAPTVDPRLAALIDRCLKPDPAERFGSGDELRDALEQLVPSARDEGDIPEGNPYRGLEAFQAEHNALFFGRDVEIRALIDRLRIDPFVLVAGDSGVGKSSLCRAGVLPRILRGAIDPERRWSAATLVPGRRPVATLVAVLASCLGTDEGSLAKEALADEKGFALEIRRRIGPAAGVMIFIDQMEELVTLSDTEQARSFAALVSELGSPNPSVRILATVRGDFLARLGLLPEMGDQIGRALYVLHPLSKSGMREAIVGPALAKGFRFESDELVEGLITSTGRSDGGLPLLQFALAELWEARDQVQRMIPASALAQVGGVSGALARHADGVLGRLPPTERMAARRMLVQLVTIEGTRARRTSRELARDASEIATLEALVQGRLFVARETEDGTVYEVAHEALLQGWSTLRDWVGEQVDSRVVCERLKMAALEWERLGRAPDGLWGERQLGEVSLVDRKELGDLESAFVDASRKTVVRNRRIKRGLAIGFVLAAVFVYGAVRFKAAHDLAQKVGLLLGSARAAHSQAEAQRRAYEAARREAFARFDGHAPEAGEIAWARALSFAQQLETSYATASQALEAALELDGMRKDVHATFGDVLYERALLAEDERQTGQLRELLGRLARHDEDGTRRRRWNAPAQVTIATSPPGAEVMLERYQSDPRGKRQAIKVRDLGMTPISDLSLEQGSYRLTFTVPGRALVRYPVRVGRDEKVRIAIDLPTASDVPPGFLYVPAGRFLFGTGAEERARRDFSFAAPIHEVTTRPYLIARYETTFRDWIEYLNTLDTKGRIAHISKTALGVDRGMAALTRASDGTYTFSFQPTNRSYKAQAGEKIHYEGRQTRAVVDWLRFPVSGISAEDAEAYVAWLRKSGRLPGARLCSELEWERAAKGADDREFPHGDHLDPDDANFDETYGKQSLGFGPDEVGSHPASRSPFDVDDMAGNVWEWTTSSLSKGQYVARGGSFYQGAPANWSTNRQLPEAAMRDLTLGMRVCLTYAAR